MARAARFGTIGLAKGLFALSLAALCAALPAAQVHAQSGRPVASETASQSVTLVADRVELRGEKLVASGTVEVFRGTDRLRATRITFDRREGTLQIEGPLTLGSL